MPLAAAGSAKGEGSAPYRITALARLGSISPDGLGLAVNDVGDVTGFYRTDIPNQRELAFYYRHGRLVTLPTLNGGQFNWGRAINNAGVAVGSSQFSDADGAVGTRGYVYRGGKLEVLSTLGGMVGNATGINDAGAIVGYASTTAGDMRAVLYDGEKLRDLGTLGGRHSFAYAISNTNLVVGGSYVKGGTRYDQHAFLWSNGVMTDLGTLYGGRSTARAVNDLGQVVGSSFNDRRDRAFLYTGGAMTDLGTFGGVSARAYGINNLGQVVGFAEDQREHLRAFLYTGNRLVDLNTLLGDDARGWQLKGAFDISDTGYITGWGLYHGVDTAFLLRPTAVPEPATFTLMLAGLASLVSFTRRRRPVP